MGASGGLAAGPSLRLPASKPPNIDWMIGDLTPDKSSLNCCKV